MSRGKGVDPNTADDGPHGGRGRGHKTCGQGRAILPPPPLPPSSTLRSSSFVRPPMTPPPPFVPSKPNAGQSKSSLAL
ncbi:hypothetical protein JCGZ_16284 [Jatropha curcas]|uniref:Uncharacterized protein n=1 Tax=Jatropha curcas TaxID=180498 RepID=A0A067L7L4_JATCU|nr:hypothetical protein JCGZ_16284 [Jatropha curcas]